jgi:hypothetical protein
MNIDQLGIDAAASARLSGRSSFVRRSLAACAVLLVAVPLAQAAGGPGSGGDRDGQRGAAQERAPARVERQQGPAPQVPVQQPPRQADPRVAEPRAAESRQLDPRSFESRSSDDQRRQQQLQQEQGNRAEAFRRSGRLTPDERRDLRRQINEAGVDIYPNTPRR